MTSKQKLSDIQYLINEFYSTDEDRDGLSESAKESRKIFNQYCRDIGKELEMMELLKPIIKACFKLYGNKIDIGYLCSKTSIKRKLKEWLEDD